MTEYWPAVHCTKAEIMCDYVYISDETVHNLPDAFVTQETADYHRIGVWYVFCENTHNQTPLHRT
jgi:hypothetical protein